METRRIAVRSAVNARSHAQELLSRCTNGYSVDLPTDRPNGKENESRTGKKVLICYEFCDYKREES